MVAELLISLQLLTCSKKSVEGGGGGSINIVCYSLLYFKKNVCCEKKYKHIFTNVVGKEGWAYKYMYIENIWLDQKSNLEPLQPLSGLYHWATQTNIHGPNSPNFCICIYIYICIYGLIVTQVHFKIYQFKIQLLTKVVYRWITKVSHSVL